MPEKEFEHTIKKMFAQHTLPPTEKVWQQVEQELHKKKRKKYFGFWLLLLFLIGIGIAIIYFDKYNVSVSKQTKENPAIQYHQNDSDTLTSFKPNSNSLHGNKNTTYTKTDYTTIRNEKEAATSITTKGITQTVTQDKNNESHSFNTKKHKTKATKGKTDVDITEPETALKLRELIQSGDSIDEANNDEYIKK